MADFYFEKYIHNYEIDFYNYHTKKEKQFFDDNNIELGCYYKDDNEWSSRISGMCFNITKSRYYPKLKKYLNHRFIIFTRKLKLEKLNEK